MRDWVALVSVNSSAVKYHLLLCNGHEKTDEKYQQLIEARIKTPSLNSIYLPPNTRLLHIMERINIIFSISLTTIWSRLTTIDHYQKPP